MPRKKAANGGGGAVAPPLARFGDPLVTADGEIIEPEQVPDESEAPATTFTPSKPTEAKSFRASTKRDLAALAAEPSTMHGCMAAFMYTTLGIGDREICIALKLEPKVLKQIRAHPAYTECFDAVQAEFINANSSMLQARIAAAAHGALDQVITISKRGKKEETRLTASRDILDRAGTKAKDANSAGSIHQMGLRITIIDSEDKIDVRPEGVG